MFCQDSKGNDFLHLFWQSGCLLVLLQSIASTKSHKIKLSVLHKAFLKAVKQQGVMTFPNSLHQGFNVIFDLKFAYKRVLMFLSDWWVSFLLLLFLSNLFNCG